MNREGGGEQIPRLLAGVAVRLEQRFPGLGAHARDDHVVSVQQLVQGGPVEVGQEAAQVVQPPDRRLAPERRVADDRGQRLAAVGDEELLLGQPPQDGLVRRARLACPGRADQEDEAVLLRERLLEGVVHRARDIGPEAVFDRHPRPEHAERERVGLGRRRQRRLPQHVGEKLPALGDRASACERCSDPRYDDRDQGRDDRARAEGADRLLQDLDQREHRRACTERDGSQPGAFPDGHQPTLRTTSSSVNGRARPGGSAGPWDRRRPRIRTWSRPTAAAGRTPSRARPSAPRTPTPGPPRCARAG